MKTIIPSNWPARWTSSCPPRNRAATYGSPGWRALRTMDPHLSRPHRPRRSGQSLCDTLAFRRNRKRPIRGADLPRHANRGTKKHPPPATRRRLLPSDLVPVGLDQSPLAATAGFGVERRACRARHCSKAGSPFYTADGIHASHPAAGTRPRKRRAQALRNSLFNLRRPLPAPAL